MAASSVLALNVGICDSLTTASLAEEGRQEPSNGPIPCQTEMHSRDPSDEYGQKNALVADDGLAQGRKKAKSGARL